ncbi:MAG: hypothetical protein AB8G05_26290, partial [Oligoflexales bacterium]
PGLAWQQNDKTSYMLRGWAPPRSFDFPTIITFLEKLGKFAKDYSALSPTYKGGGVFPIMHYLLGAYQLGTIKMRHSGEYRKIQNNFALKISEEIAPDQIEEIIAKMEISQTRTNIYFIYSQIKMIQRHLDIEI